MHPLPDLDFLTSDGLEPHVIYMRVASYHTVRVTQVVLVLVRSELNEKRKRLIYI